MTEEEFENKVLSAFKNNICDNCADKEICLTNMLDCNQYNFFYNALKIGYELGKKKDIFEFQAELEKENAELKAQIEKMKNMQNCKHNWETKGQCIWKNGGYCVCKMWELAE